MTTEHHDDEFRCAECEAVIHDMVAQGYFRDTSRRRNGQVLWERTSKRAHPHEFRTPEGNA
jgi:hypothetical protein